MSFRIAVPKNKIFSKLYSNNEFITNNPKISLIMVDEKDIYSFLWGEKVDLALMSPLSYSQGVVNSDFRIINAPSLSVEGYSALASIFFNRGLKSINSVISSNNNDFLIQIGKIMLAEKFDLQIDMKYQKGNTGELLQQFDCVIDWNNEDNRFESLDITEEWFDNFEIPLPLCFWVCKADSYPEGIDKIPAYLADPLLDDEEIINDLELATALENEYDPRQGRLIWKMDDDFEHNLSQVLQLLYFHQLIDNIGAVKLFNRD